jgi:hypothetical protein
MEEKSAVAEELKPGTGVDRTQIQRLLEVPPAERLRMLVVEARNVAELLTKMRRR